MRFSKPMDDVVYVRVSLDEKRALAEAAPMRPATSTR